MLIKSKRAVKPFRTQLVKLLYDGRARLRVFGTAGQWFLGIQRNVTVHKFSAPFSSREKAIRAARSKLGMTPSRLETADTKGVA